MLRDAEHLDHIRAVLHHTNLSVLQAGVSVFEAELNALSSQYPGHESVWCLHAKRLIQRYITQCRRRLVRLSKDTSISTMLRALQRV